MISKDIVGGLHHPKFSVTFHAAKVFSISTKAANIHKTLSEKGILALITKKEHCFIQNWIKILFEY